MDARERLQSKLGFEFSRENANDTKSGLDLNNMKKELNNSYKPKVKKETKEATGSGAAGAFVPAMGSKQETNEKWSQKYKKSIDCNNPKGFSQRAHCQGKKKKMQESLTEAERTFMAKLRDLAKKYAQDDSKDVTTKEKIEKIHQELKKEFLKGIKVEKEHKSGDPKQIALDHLSEDPKYYTKLKKVEATEATGASSAGQYSSPSFLAKSMSPKKWRGKSKTQIPGGQFVEVKKKCKKFPYCNQGDIRALKIFENDSVQNAIDSVSSNYKLDKDFISEIIFNEIKKRQK